jgi:hypothetical protein
LLFTFILQDTISQLEEINQTLQKELQELKGIHHITQLRAEKQNEWNDRVVTELKDEIQVSRKLMKQMISIDQYKIDLDHIKALSSATMVLLYCIPPLRLNFLHQRGSCF